jgi:hypothetical protein
LAEIGVAQLAVASLHPPLRTIDETAEFNLGIGAAHLSQHLLVGIGKVDDRQTIGDLSCVRLASLEEASIICKVVAELEAVTGSGHGDLEPLKCEGFVGVFVVSG